MAHPRTSAWCSVNRRFWLKDCTAQIICIHTGWPDPPPRRPFRLTFRTPTCRPPPLPPFMYIYFVHTLYCHILCYKPSSIHFSQFLCVLHHHPPYFRRSAMPESPFPLATTYTIPAFGFSNNVCGFLQVFSNGKLLRFTVWITVIERSTSKGQSTEATVIKEWSRKLPW